MAQFSIAFNARNDPDGTKNLTLSTIRKLFSLGTITEEVAIARIMVLGYSDNDARLLLSLSKEAEQADKTIDHIANNKRRFERLAEKAFVKGIWGEQQTTTVLVLGGFTPSEVDAEIQYLRWEREFHIMALKTAPIRGLYKQYYISSIEAGNRLNEIGYDLVSISGMLSVWDVERENRTRNISTGEAKKLFKLKKIKQIEFTNILLSLGYNDAAIGYQLLLAGIDFDSNPLPDEEPEPDDNREL